MNVSASGSAQQVLQQLATTGNQSSTSPGAQAPNQPGNTAAASQVQAQAQTNPSSTGPTGKEENSEAQAAQAAEGEKGANINTFA